MENLADANVTILWSIFIDGLFYVVPSAFLIGLVANLK